MEKELMIRYRSFLKDSIRKEIDFSKTDQFRGVPAPPIEKPCLPDAEITELPGVGSFQDQFGVDLQKAIRNRESRRSYRSEPITLEELSFLL